MKKDEILVPIFTPFNEDFTVDYPQLAKLVRAVLDKGADGIYAGGSSAEFVLLSEEERRKTLETVVKAADGAQIVAHIGSPSTDLAISFAKHAASLGVDALASVPPFYSSWDAQEIMSYYTDISEASGLKIMVYSLSSLGTMSLEQLLGLLLDEHVYALKYTQADYYVLQRLRELGKKPVYSGKDEAFASALMAGATGAIGTSMNLVPEKFIRIKAAFERGDVKSAMAEQNRLNNIIQPMVEARCIAGMKYGAEVVGLMRNHVCRRPNRPLTAPELARIKTAVVENV